MRKESHAEREAGTIDRAEQRRAVKLRGRQQKDDLLHSWKTLQCCSRCRHTLKIYKRGHGALNYPEDLGQVIAAHWDSDTVWIQHLCHSDLKLDFNFQHLHFFFICNLF